MACKEKILGKLARKCTDPTKLYLTFCKTSNFTCTICFDCEEQLIIRDTTKQELYTCITMKNNSNQEMFIDYLEKGESLENVQIS